MVCPLFWMLAIGRFHCVTDKNKNIKNRNVYHKKPRPSTYLLQSLQGQLFGIHFLIDFLELLKDWAFFNSIGPISHILVLDEEYFECHGKLFLQKVI